jgi:hypothetical protein
MISHVILGELQFTHREQLMAHMNLTREISAIIHALVFWECTKAQHGRVNWMVPQRTDDE